MQIKSFSLIFFFEILLVIVEAFQTTCNLRGVIKNNFDLFFISFLAKFDTVNIIFEHLIRYIKLNDKYSLPKSLLGANDMGTLKSIVSKKHHV